MSDINWWQSAANTVGAAVGAGGATYLSYKYLTWRERLELRRLKRLLRKTTLQLTSAIADVQAARREYLESEEEEVKHGDTV